MLKNNKGFTLVELLAVIVILGIILAIAIPSITGLIRTQKERAFEATALLLIKGLEYKALETSTAVTTGVKTASEYGVSATEVTALEVTVADPITITVAGGGKFAGCTITAKSRTNMAVDADSCN